jgi:SAM-dependent methyltransferase
MKGKTQGYRLWGKFRSSQLWTLLRRVGFLRSGWYLALEIHKALSEPQTSSMESVDQVFRTCNDPYKYETNPLEQSRFIKQTELLDEVRKGGLFQTGLEIGCAEGLYTEILAERCESLLVLDLSPTALARTQRRRSWSEKVRFSAFDLRGQVVPGTFDLIVVAGVLEYFDRPSTLLKIRQKLISALRPDGILMVETTRKSPDIENTWWGRRFVRGKWINVFIGEHRSLAVISATMTDSYSISLYQNIGRGSTQ